MNTVYIITLSDRAFAGTYPDLSTPALERWLKNKHVRDIQTTLIPDDSIILQSELRRGIENAWNLILTCGGTGTSERDRTPEGTLPVLERIIPGIPEMIRHRGVHPFSYVSRGLCGISKKTIILNLSGNPNGAVEQLEIAWDSLCHAISTLNASSSS